MKRSSEWLIREGAWVFIVVVWALFACLTDKFLTMANLLNIGVQSASIAILATGMTLVLLTGGVDLSVGAVMFVSAAIAGKLAAAGFSLPLIALAMLGVGIIAGAINGFLVTRILIVPFIATLGTLYVGRGLGLWLTETRAMNLPDSFVFLGSQTLGLIPIPIWTLVAVVATGQVLLTRTPLGRHLMAIGYNRGFAEKAGVPTRKTLIVVYIFSGAMAALASLVSLSQLGAVSPTFGESREFTAIAASVLGGTSLFGGRGSVFPGALVGALLLQSVENGLVLVNADPYLYPMILAVIIFIAVLLDSGRTAMMQSIHRRPIFYR